MQELTLDVRKRACGFGKSRRLYDVRRGEINSAELSAKITDGGETLLPSADVMPSEASEWCEVEAPEEQEQAE